MEGRQRGLSRHIKSMAFSATSAFQPRSKNRESDMQSVTGSPHFRVSSMVVHPEPNSPSTMSTECFQTAVAIMCGFEQFGLGHTCHFLSSGWSVGMHVQDGLAGIYVLSHLISVHSVNHSGSAFTVIRSSSRASVPKTICSPPCHFLSLLCFKGKVEKILATPGSITTAT